MHILIFYSLFLCWNIIPSYYSKCLTSYPCGNLTLEFPFTDVKHPDCGLFHVGGCDSLGDPPIIFIGSSASLLGILEKISTNKFLVRDLGLDSVLRNHKCFGFLNMSLPQSPSVSFTFSPNLTLFTCYKHYTDQGFSGKEYFKNYTETACEIASVYYKTPAATHEVNSSSIPRGCVVSEQPMSSENKNGSGEVFDVLSANFSLEWSVSKACYQCYHGGGQCLADSNNKFYCKQGTLNMHATNSISYLWVFWNTGSHLCSSVLTEFFPLFLLLSPTNFSNPSVVTRFHYLTFR